MSAHDQAAELAAEFAALAGAVQHAGDQLAAALVSRGLHPVGVRTTTREAVTRLDRLAGTATRCL